MQLISSDYIVKSPLPDIDIPDCDIWSFLSQYCQKNGDKTALLDSSTNENATYNQFDAKSQAIAKSLLVRGCDITKPVCIYMKNSIEFLLITVAVWRIGGKVACINSLLTKGEIETSIQNLASEYLFCDRNTVDNAVECLITTPLKECFIKGTHPHCTLMSSLYRFDQNTALSKLSINPRKDVALILFSSGTTGLPKAVEITHRGIIAQTRIMGGPEMDSLPHHSGIIYQPFSHIYGISLCIMHLAYGVKTVIMPVFNLERYISLVEEHKVDQLYIVPPIAVTLTRSNITNKYDLSHVQSISSGAAPLSKEVEENMKQMLHPGVQVKQSWGMTELVSMGLTVPSKGICHRYGLTVPQGSAGLPIPNVKMKVVDLVSGKALGPEMKGEVCAISNHFMKGYYNNKQATDNTIDKDGWVHTGDIGYYDAEGYFFIVDKMKEIIKYKGYQVAPAELEGVLLTHPLVADAGVTGIPDSFSGEIPHAWVVRKPSRNCTESELISYVKEQVAPYKWLRGGIRFVDEIPKTVSGKILRREINKQSLLHIKKAKL